MRKIYYLFLTMLLGMVGMSANAQETKSMKVIFNVDNPDNITISIDGVSQNIVAGDNEITLNAPNGYYSYVNVNATDGNFITKVTKDGNNQLYSAYNSYWSYSPLDADADKTIYIETAKGDDVRTASCKVTVDDPSKVSVQRNGTYSTVSLVEGENIVTYIPGYETMLMISSTTYGTPLYKVTLNGEELVYSSGYSATLNANQVDEIDIKANFPEGLEYNVKFTYVDADKADGVVTGVTVNGTSIENYDVADGFKVPAGQSVAITFDNVNYKIDAVKLNDNPITVYSSYSFTPTADTEINIDAHKWGTVKATLNIDNKDNVIVYRGYSYNNDIIDVINGANEIERPENDAVITIKPNSGCFITSVSYGGNVYTNQSEYSITLTDGMEISVVSGAIVRDNEFTINIDDVTAAIHGCYIMRANDRSTINVATGDNVIDFADNETEYSFNAYGSSIFAVFKNGVKLPLTRDNDTYVTFIVENGDKLNAYLKQLPSTYDVTFTLGDGVNAYDINVSTDAAGSNNKWSTAGITAISGTSFTITLSPTISIDVKVNGNTINPKSDGTFEIPVSAATTVEITESTGTGINTINAASADNSFYTLQGVKSNGKAKGLYIKNGKKVVVK